MEEKEKDANGVWMKGTRGQEKSQAGGANLDIKH